MYIVAYPYQPKVSIEVKSNFVEYSKQWLYIIFYEFEVQNIYINRLIDVNFWFYFLCAAAFKGNIQSDGTITIKGVTYTGEKKVHAHGMVFEMHTQNLCPPGDFSVSFQLGGDVDPSTLEHVLANGVLEGVVKKKPIQRSWSCPQS